MLEVRDPIDAHVHLMPERLMEAVHRVLVEKTGWDSIDHPLDRQGMERTLRRSGVRRYFALPYAHKPGIAEDLNRFVLEQASHSDMAVPFATVHPDDDVGPVVRSAFEAGAAGLKFQCPVQQCGPADPRLFPAFERATEYDRPIVFHASSVPHYEENPYVGVEPVEQFLRRFPEVRVCIAHMGAFETEAFQAMARGVERVYLDTTMVLSEHSREVVGFDPSTVSDRTLDELSSSVMYGSDFPNVPYRYPGEYEALQRRDLPARAYEDIFRDSALRFLGETSPH